MTYYDLTTNLFFQLALIIFTCRLLVFIGKRYLYQTEVVSEMLAGLILGPSVFGFIFPQLQQFVFPSAPQLLADGTNLPNISMTLLFVISQIGIVLYMFIAGMEFSFTKVSYSLKSVAFLSLSGMLFPFIFGAVFIASIQTDGLIEPGIPPHVAMIYFGCIISVTAFPVLVQIMDEKKITKSSLGQLVLATGSCQDVVAWTLVALILSMIQHNVMTLILMIFGTVFYVIFMIYLSYFLKHKFSNQLKEELKPNKQIISLILIVLMLAAVAVDKIGLYSAFGAFIAGTVIPKGQFATRLKNKFSFLTTSLMLPVFFTFSGLNTKISLINTLDLWLITGGVILIALFGKMVVCTIAARIIGAAKNESMAYGVLMNTRGLLELIILNIGLQHHIISLTLYTIGIIMTLTTTIMTSPLLVYLSRRRGALHD